MLKTLKCIFYLASLLLSTHVLAQEQVLVTGKIVDKFNRPMDNVNIVIVGYPTGSTSDAKGNYKLFVPKQDIELVYSSIGYAHYTYKLSKDTLENYSESNPLIINAILAISDKALDVIHITDTLSRSNTMQRINPKVVSTLPDASGDYMSSAIKTQIGVSSSNELSTQYTVRGGNFDENLVYVNDIEIYRPFLIRAGQQEGLSFVNGDMVGSIQFSAGGFEAKYGDKMSSVLDIKYKKPTEWETKISASLLGSSAFVQGLSKDSRFTFMTGVRYKTSRYLLNSLETEGDYIPSFTDVQTFITYDVSKKLELNFLGNIARNKFDFAPQSRSSSYGTFDRAINMSFYFDGKEQDKFDTYTGAISAEYKPKDSLQLKFIASAFNTSETETYDIASEYYLNDIEEQLGAGQGDSSLNLGIGKSIEHARNFLNANVFNLSHKGLFIKNKLNLQWGAVIKREIIHDEISEWKLMDSAGYAIPYHSDSIILNRALKSDSDLESNRISSFVQGSYTYDLTKGYLTFTGGARASYWGLNKELIFSPRASVAYHPGWETDLLFRISGGVYHQSPFFKELRDFDGKLNLDIKSPRSVQIVAGSDLNFTAWDRPFKFITEIYYKKFTHLIPYQVENVRIRYYAFDASTGYAAGIDMKVNGEFVKGVESWASLSIMQTEEDIIGDGYGNIPRPTDQLINLGLYFQDYMPGNDRYKMHLSLLYGSPLPFGPPDWGRHAATARMPAYKRVDLGFSYLVRSENYNIAGVSLFNKFKSLWLSFEVFNLLDVRNTVSYTWVSVVPNSRVAYNEVFHQYAVPNKLTSRRLNLRLTASF